MPAPTTATSRVRTNAAVPAVGVTLSPDAAAALAPPTATAIRNGATPGVSPYGVLRSAGMLPPPRGRGQVAVRPATPGPGCRGPEAARGSPPAGAATSH